MENGWVIINLASEPRQIHTRVFLVVSYLLEAVKGSFCNIARPPTDTTWQIAETLVISLGCVSALPRAGLRRVSLANFALSMVRFSCCVDWGV